MRYTIHNLDVWGNNTDGYEVNDVYPSSGEIEATVETTDHELIKALKSTGHINPKCHYASFEIDGDEMNIYIDYSTTRVAGYPLLELRVVD